MWAPLKESGCMGNEMFGFRYKLCTYISNAQPRYQVPVCDELWLLPASPWPCSSQIRDSSMPFLNFNAMQGMLVSGEIIDGPHSLRESCPESFGPAGPWTLLLLSLIIPFGNKNICTFFQHLHIIHHRSSS